jgi:hypothetical protein
MYRSGSGYHATYRMSETFYRLCRFLYMHRFNHATLNSLRTPSVRRNLFSRFGNRRWIWAKGQISDHKPIGMDQVQG